VKTLVCGRCHLDYTDEDWGSLALAQRLAPSEVRRLALNWPADVCVEARRCSRCESMVVAKRRWPADHGGERR
jgi:hypothetical protein